MLMIFQSKETNVRKLTPWRPFPEGDAEAVAFSEL